MYTAKIFGQIVILPVLNICIYIYSNQNSTELQTPDFWMAVH